METIRCYCTSRPCDDAGNVCRPFLYVTGITLFDHGDDDDDDCLDSDGERPIVNLAVLWRDGGSEVHEGWHFDTGRAAGSVEVRRLSLQIDSADAGGGGTVPRLRGGPALSVGAELDFGWFECRADDLLEGAPTACAESLLALSCHTHAHHPFAAYHEVAGVAECTEGDLGALLGGVAVGGEDGSGVIGSAVDALGPAVEGALSVVWGLRTAQSASHREVSPHLLGSLRSLITLARRAAGAPDDNKAKPCFRMMVDLAREDEKWHRVYGGLRLLATLLFSTQHESNTFGAAVMRSKYRDGLGDLGFVCLQHRPPAPCVRELYAVGNTCANGAGCARRRGESTLRTVLQSESPSGRTCLACSSKEPEDPWASDAEDKTPEGEEEAEATQDVASPRVDEFPVVCDNVFEARAAAHGINKLGRLGQNEQRLTDLVRAQVMQDAAAPDAVV
eukprot:Rhum_TRINITY_DN12422_c0_g1::Rhum_TRINITY_DN12422_c0_g1_i1::g.51757::m.51757